MVQIKGSGRFLYSIKSKGIFMSDKIDDFKFVHISNVYSRNSSGQLVSQVNWKTEGEMAVYGKF